MLKKFDELYKESMERLDQLPIKETVTVKVENVDEDEDDDSEEEMPKHFIKANVEEDRYGGIEVTFDDGSDLYFQPGDDSREFLKNCWRDKKPHDGCKSGDEVDGVLSDYWDLAKEHRKYEELIKKKSK